MDSSTPMDGSFVTSVIHLGPNPSPWLRLAHRQEYPASHDGRYAYERHILDHEFIYQLKGDSWCYFPDHDGMVLVPEGSVILLPPHVYHAYCHPEGSHIAVHFDLEPRPEVEIDNMLHYHQRQHARSSTLLKPLLEFRDGSHQRQVTMVHRPLHSQQWLSRMNELTELWGNGRHRQPGMRLRSASIIGALLHQFAYGQQANATLSQEEKIWLSLTEIDLSNRQLRITDLAASAELGETAYRSAVRRLTGTTPRAWLEQRRCEQAMVMFQSGQQSVQEVAMACGYEDPYHFSRVMKRVYGKAPSAFIR